MRLFFFIAILVPALPLGAQFKLSGLIRDADQKTPLAYANIGILHKAVGTVASATGTFSLELPAGCEQDTLGVSMVGYKEMQLPVSFFKAFPTATLSLHPKPVTLDEVTAVSRSWKEQTIGIKRYNPLLHFIDGSTRQDDIFEIAQLMRLGNHRSKILSVNLFINESSNDSGLFRLNFYRYENGLPAERLVEKNILQTKAIREGWLQLDVAKENIYLKGDVVVAIEFIPSASTSRRILYEVKLGGTSHSFVRSSSQADWQRPPHHYRMNIRILGDPETAPAGDEEKESPPALRLYSPAVRDSFYVFLSLPKHYEQDRERTYPVVYLLDGNAYFDALKTPFEKLDRDQECILVGIGYRDAFLANSLRDRDFTYPAALPSDSMTRSGGADRFLRFLKEELLPYIDQHYRGDTSDRRLMGHSLAGYFVLYTLLQDLKTNQHSFQSYVAASPSLDYGHGYLQEQFKALAPGQTRHELYITIGDKEEELKDFNTFLELLRSKNLPLDIESKVFRNHEHMETALPSFETR